MITDHQFISKYPIIPERSRLIVGTIHPHNLDDFLIKFFYGNVSSLWNIFRDAFPTTFKDPVTLDSVLEFLKEQDITVTDTILKCKRVSPTALDKDLEVIKLNEDMITSIKNSKITEIFFTSGFGKNAAFRLFYCNILGLKITKCIREQRGLILDPAIFGRSIKLTILYSPSGSSNIGISKSKLYLANKHKYLNNTSPVYQFKVDYYREKFNK